MADVVTAGELPDGHSVLDAGCLDRIYLNAYVPVLQSSGQVAAFMTQHLGKPIPSPALMEHIGTRFRKAVGSCASSDGIPWVRFGKGDRKIDVMQPYLQAQAATGRSGVAAAGVAQEFQRVWSACQRDTQTAAPQYTFSKAGRRVTCYCFYLWDEDPGGAFIKACAYFPYPAKIWVNGHERARRQALRAGIGFTELSGGFASCEDPAALQEICDRLQPGTIEVPAQRWMHRIPMPSGSKDHDAGYWRECSMRQAGVSRTIVFGAPHRARSFPGALIAGNLDLGRPQNAEIIFGRRVRSDKTESPDPGSSRPSPIRYFQPIRIRTASAAIRSVSFSARCSTVTSASRNGDHPGRPRSPNADANSSSPSHWPGRSRTCTASGRGLFLPSHMAATAAAICGSGSGQAAGCMDTAYPIPRPGRGTGKEQTAAGSILASPAARIEHLARRATNKPAGSTTPTQQPLLPQYPGDHAADLAGPSPEDVEAGAGRLREELRARIAGCFPRRESRANANALIDGLLTELEDRNCWSLAEAAGHSAPHRLQHLLSRGARDEQQLLDAAAAWAIGQLDDGAAVMIIDETPDVKASAATAGAARQYCGSTGTVAMCQVAVTATYATSRHHPRPRPRPRTTTAVKVLNAGG